MEKARPVFKDTQGLASFWRRTAYSKLLSSSTTWGNLFRYGGCKLLFIFLSICSMFCPFSGLMWKLRFKWCFCWIWICFHTLFWFSTDPFYFSSKYLTFGLFLSWILANHATALCLSHLRSSPWITQWNVVLSNYLSVPLLYFTFFRSSPILVSSPSFYFLDIVFRSSL